MSDLENTLVAEAITWRHRCGGECKRTLCPFCKRLYRAVDAVIATRPPPTRPCLICETPIRVDPTVEPNKHIAEHFCDACYTKLGRPSQTPEQWLLDAARAQREDKQQEGAIVGLSIGAITEGYEAMERVRKHLLYLLHEADGFPDAERHDTAVVLHGLAVALDGPEVEA